MRRSAIKNITVEYSFYLFAAIFVLLIPLRLAIAWLLAVVIHEFCHYLALRVCKVTIISVSISATGIKMETELMTGKQEFICALSGPLGGFLILLLARWLPCTAICALVHSLFNLIPIYPLDGGRALRCVMYKLFGDRYGEVISTWIGYVFLAILVILVLALVLRFDLGILPVGLMTLFFGKIKLANRGNK